MAQQTLFAGIPLKIPAPDLPVPCNRLIDRGNVGKDLLVRRFQALFHIHLLMQDRRLVPASQSLQLADQLHAFRHSDCLGGLHCINQELQLRRRKTVCAEVIMHLPVTSDPDIQPVQLQKLQIIIQAFSFGANAVFGKLPRNFGKRETMRFVGRFAQNFHQVQKLQFLIGLSRHNTPPLAVLERSGFRRQLLLIVP